jgi:precorrin-6A/cobalt-precorrin-6A reductase
MVRVLILSGTSEAAAFAEACARDRDFEVVCSLAGRTSSPRPLPGEVRVGGFGGAAGLERFLRTRAIDRLVDATHPFAAQMSWNALQACRAAAVPRLRLLRRPWQRQAGDGWVEVDDLAEAAQRLPTLGRRAFLSVGQKDLAAFADLEQVWFLVRTIEAPERLPLREAKWLVGRGPFRLEGELALLKEHRIDVLVAKASGGAATYAKLAAARALGLPVIMLRRPPPPPGPVVATVGEALDWLRLSRAPVEARGGDPAHRAGCR